MLHYVVTDHRALSGAREIAFERPNTITPTVGSALFAVYDNLSAALSGKADLLSSGDSALKSARVIAAIQRSANTDGQFERIPL